MMKNHNLILVVVGLLNLFNSALSWSEQRTPLYVVVPALCGVALLSLAFARTRRTRS